MAKKRRSKRKPPPPARRLMDLEARVFELESALARERQDHGRTRRALEDARRAALSARVDAGRELTLRRRLFRHLCESGDN